MALKHLIDGGARRRRTWQAAIVTHRLNLNPFNNHRRSVHKARSTPCFLLLSLPWRSSHDMVPPPCISLPWTHAHTNAHTALPLSDYFPWEPKGHCDDHELEWNPSVPSPFIQSPPRRLVVSQVAQKGADDGGGSVFILRGGCAGKPQSSDDSIFFNKAKWFGADGTAVRSGHFCLPSHGDPGVHVWIVSRSSTQLPPPRPAMSNFVAHYPIIQTHMHTQTHTRTRQVR